MHTSLKNVLIKALAFSIIICTQSAQAMMNQRYARAILHNKTQLQKSVKNMDSKRNLWINGTPSDSITHKAGDAALGAAGGSAGIIFGGILGYPIGGLILGIPYGLAKIENSPGGDGCLAGILVGGIGGSVYAGGPIGLASFGALLAGSYAIGKHKESTKNKHFSVNKK